MFILINRRLLYYGIIAYECEFKFKFNTSTSYRTLEYYRSNITEVSEYHIPFEFRE